MRTIISIVILGAGMLTIFLFYEKQYNVSLEVQPEAQEVGQFDEYGDIAKQSPLKNPPTIIKAIYATGWSAGNEKRLSYLVNLIQETELNAIVIDVKDYTGAVSYLNNIPEIFASGAAEKRIPKINALIKKLHDLGIYVIGRVAVFQDQKLSLARPELALKSKSTGKLWKDNKGLHWLDTSAKEAWDYNIAIAHDMIARGFDEINFDYIRFPSDGNLDDVVYPKYKSTSAKATIVKNFYAYLRDALPDARLSADVFGMTTTNADDLGIGQHLEDALPYFDALAPMVYPSHYGSGFIGQKNPAAAPYEIVKYSIKKALEKIATYRTTWLLAARSGDAARLAKMPESQAKLRPWLQDFNLGATYRAKEILAQIQATTDAVGDCGAICETSANGWMLWNASNIYTSDALQKEPSIATTTAPLNPKP